MKNNNLYELGYLSWQDLQKYQNQKLWKNLCSAHAVDIKANTELRLLMQTKPGWKDWLFHKKERQCEHRLKLDFETSRLMQDRLSSVKIK